MPSSLLPDWPTEYPATWADLRAGERVLLCRLTVSLRGVSLYPKQRASAFDTIVVEPGVRIPLSTPAHRERCAFILAAMDQRGKQDPSVEEFAERVAEQDSLLEQEKRDTVPVPLDKPTPVPPRKLPPLPPPRKRQPRPPTLVNLGRKQKES